ncbi:MAG: SMP-30/gluconolactonase/LRE family protein, partial [Allomuricauda sp.]
LLDSTVTKPNGIRLSPDEKKLYLAVSDPKHSVWYQYDVLAPGKVENKRIFYDATHLVGKEGEQGLPDGLKINSDGYLFATGPGGVWIFNQQAKPIAKIRTGEATSNCAFSTDEKRLFITADNFVLGVDLK